MKPVKLVIEGINSFIEPQTLDFEAVGRTNLFCISGKTGAGKTTIFDSLMLALYGRSGKGNLADVVNLSRMSAKVTLDFTENGEMYTVERTIKCRSEKSEKTQKSGIFEAEMPEKAEKSDKTERRTATSDCMLYKNGVPVAKGEDATEFIKNIIGLEAGEFKNVYLLEQGEYAEFLKKPPAKQTEAVGKIFSLMRFGDVQKLAGERKRTEEREAEAFDSRIRDLGDVSQEKLHESKTELTALKAKTTALRKDEESKRAELSVLEKARLEFISVREKQNNVKNLMLLLDEQNKKAGAAAERLEQFERGIDTSVGEKLTAVRETLNNLSSLNSIDKEYAAAVKEAETKSKTCADKTEQLEKTEAQLKILESQLLSDLAAFTEECKKFISCANDISQKSNALQNGAEILSGDNVDVTVVTEIYHTLENEYNSYGVLASAREEKRKKLDSAKNNIEKQLKIIESYSAELKSLAEQKKAATEAERSAAKALAEAQLCSHAAAVRAELHAGDKCPVCGGVYGGGGDGGDTDVEKRKLEHEQAEKNLKAIAETETERIKHSDRAKADYERQKEEQTSIEKEMSEIDDKIAATCVAPDIYKKLFDILGAAKKKSERKQASERQLAERQPAIASLKAEAAAAQSAADEARKKAEDYKSRLGENCGKTDELIKAAREREAEFNNAIEQIENTRKTLSGEAESAKAAARSTSEMLEKARADCPVDIPPFDEDGYNEKRDILEQLGKRIAENDKDIAVKDIEIKTLAENCERQAKFAAEKSEHLKKAKIYGTIEDLTKAKAMLNYVAAEYIAEFTAAASEILTELSGGKYTMSYDKINGFIVSDYLNGGKSRKTDTLSGGELFLASLSVAIAIARTQSSGNNAFFFLDEGFGTLDEELIDTVFGALESLSRDCLVGVISHAAALIDRMPSCVEVLEATDTAGSIIKY